MSRRLLQTLLVCLVLLALAAVPGWAQLDTGRIVGTVVDKTGAAVAGADIKITNQRTGRVTEAKTGSIGEFATPPLAVGVYKVEAAREGFKAASVSDVVLHATETARADMRLDIGTTVEVVNVTAEQTSVNTTSADLGATVDTLRVNNLPLNGRDFTSLVALVPGAVTTTGGQNSIGGFETTYAGVNVLLDGADATRIDTNATSTQMGRQESRISRASVDSIAEFRVLQSNYSAEYGRSMGDILNVITKSGGNDFHGSIFEYLRNNKFDARNYFDQQENPLRLNQFGGNISGPLVKDKLFFFSNYEGVRQVVHTPTEVLVLNAANRARFVPSMYPVRDAIPVGNGGPANANLDYYRTALRNSLREDTGSLKIDLNASTEDTFNFRYNIADSFTSTQYGAAIGQVAPSYSRNHLFKTTWNHTFASTMLNEFGVAFNRPKTESLGGGGDLPMFQCFYCDDSNNFGLTPGPALFSNRSPQYSYQFMDNLSWIKNRQSMRFGADIRHNVTKRATDPQRFLAYAGVNDFVTNNGFALSTLGYEMVGIENTNYNFYFQDDIRVTSRLSLNLGVRYEYNSVLHGDRIANFDFATLKVLNEGDGLYEPDRNNFAPRVGFSWDPLGTGKTVVRGGFGIFFNPLLTGAGLQLAQNTQPNFNVNIIDLLFGLRSCDPAMNSISYPLPANLPTCTPALPQNITFLDRNMRDTYAEHWSFGIQQEMFKNTVLEVAYVGNHGVKLPAGAASAGLELNLEPWLGTPTIPDPEAKKKYANIRRFGNFLGSRYDALQASLRRHIGNGLNLDVNYTWSHEFDNAVNIFSAFQNSARPQDDWSVGDIDIRHNFSLALVYDVPAANWLPKGVAKGWQLSSLFQTRTGTPFNISMSSPFLGLDLIRPNLKAGQSITPANYSVPNGQLNFGAFADPGFLAYGNLPRNAGRGPGFAQVDFAIAKTTKLTERLGLQFRVETFNLLNRPNFANPVGTLSSGEAQFGRSLSTIGNKVGTGTSRQLQFATKLVF